jgi:hypothetical protein
VIIDYFLRFFAFDVAQGRLGGYIKRQPRQQVTGLLEIICQHYYMVPCLVDSSLRVAGTGECMRKSPPLQTGMGKLRLAGTGG